MVSSNLRPKASLPVSWRKSVVPGTGATPTSDPILINYGTTPRHRFLEKEKDSTDPPASTHAHSTGGGARILRTRSADTPGDSCSGGWVHGMEEVQDALSLSLCECAFALELEDDRFLRFSSPSGTERIHLPKTLAVH